MQETFGILPTAAMDLALQLLDEITDTSMPHEVQVILQYERCTVKKTCCFNTHSRVKRISSQTACIHSCHLGGVLKVHVSHYVMCQIYIHLCGNFHCIKILIYKNFKTVKQRIWKVIELRIQNIKLGEVNKH